MTEVYLYCINCGKSCMIGEAYKEKATDYIYYRCPKCGDDEFEIYEK